MQRSRRRSHVVFARPYRRGGAGVFCTAAPGPPWPAAGSVPGGSPAAGTGRCPGPRSGRGAPCGGTWAGGRGNSMGHRTSAGMRREGAKHRRETWEGCGAREGDADRVRWGSLISQAAGRLTPPRLRLWPPTSPKLQRESAKPEVPEKRGDAAERAAPARPARRTGAARSRPLFQSITWQKFIFGGAGGKKLFSPAAPRILRSAAAATRPGTRPPSVGSSRLAGGGRGEAWASGPWYEAGRSQGPSP